MIVLKIWVNAFIPRDIPGLTEPVLNGPYAGGTMIRGPVSGVSDCFLTDNRGFDANPQASSRMHSEVKIHLFGPDTKIIAEGHRCDPSIGINCVSGAEECKGSANTDHMRFFGLTIAPVGEDITWNIQVSGAAANGCIPLSPDIDYEGKVTFWLSTGQVSFDGKIDQFPAFEMYAALNNLATPDNGVGQPIFQTMPLPGKTPWNLLGSANRVQTGSVILPPPPGF